MIAILLVSFVLFCQIQAATAHASRLVLDNSCSTGADCADTECCVSNMQPGGKRAIGTCQAMGTFGSGCLVRYASGKPVDVVFACPCSSGLTCHGNGMFDMPLGETGTCM